MHVRYTPQKDTGDSPKQLITREKQQSTLFIVQHINVMACLHVLVLSERLVN